MSPNGRPRVESAEPSEKQTRVVNPIIKALLRSPLHWLVSKHLMLLTFVGRNTGKTYTIPVGRHELDGTLMVVTGRSRWRHNLRGGVPVEVLIEGRRRRGRAELVEDPEEVSRVYELLLNRVGLTNAWRLGLKVNVDRRPTKDELKAALAGRGVVRIELD